MSLVLLNNSCNYYLTPTLSKGEGVDPDLIDIICSIRAKNSCNHFVISH